MRKEIEVKAKVDSLDEAERKLAEMGCVLSGALAQHDVVFVEDDYGPFEVFRPKKNLLRIRESGGEFILTLKRPVANQLDSLEHETKISDPAETKEILNLMGYHEIVAVDKIRRKANFNGMEICLDQVDGLGTFLEAERIVEDAEAEIVQNELFAFLQKLGVKPEDRIYDGYDTLIYLQKPKKK